MSTFSLQVVLRLMDNDGAQQDSLQLRAESIVHSISRNPVIFSIPGIGSGDSGDGIPKIFGLDFGMLTENMILSGILPDNDPSGTELPTFPNHVELANAARTWWRYAAFADSFEPENGIILEIQEGPGHGQHRYRCIIQALTCGREGGKTTWSYKLTLAITAFPESGGNLW